LAAGCRVANLEFNQFHPTCLFHPQARNFLMTKALRGEGAYLKRPDGSRFMPEFDPRGELALLDIVASAIDHEMKRLGADCIYLDISHKPAEFISQNSPMIHENFLTLGFDLTQQPIANRAGCTLHLRRCNSRSAWWHQSRWVVCYRRGQLYQRARNQPHVFELIVGVSGLRLVGGGTHLEAPAVYLVNQTAAAMG